MENRLQSLKAEAVEALSAITGQQSLEEFRVTFLGRKGLLSSVMKELSQAPRKTDPV